MRTIRGSGAFACSANSISASISAEDARLSIEAILAMIFFLKSFTIVNVPVPQMIMQD
jgi:hypothetical protein